MRKLKHETLERTFLTKKKKYILQKSSKNIFYIYENNYKKTIETRRPTGGKNPLTQCSLKLIFHLNTTYILITL